MIEPLPAVLREIADVVGEVNALIIASKKGGVRFYIPTKVSDEHWLVDALGREAAEKLCAHFTVDGRGQHVDIPLYVGGTYKQLMREIAKQIEQYDNDDALAQDVATKAGVSQRTVHRHRARHRGDARALLDQDGKPRQGKLF